MVWSLPCGVVVVAADLVCMLNDSVTGLPPRHVKQLFRHIGPCFHPKDSRPLSESTLFRVENPATVTFSALIISAGLVNQFWCHFRFVPVLRMSPEASALQASMPPRSR